MQPDIEDVLRSAGLDPERIETPSGIAYRVRRIPRSVRTTGVSRTGSLFVIAERPAAECIGSIVETGSIELAGTEMPLHRCATVPSLRRVDKRIPEGEGNLARRGDWFRKRQ